MPETSETIERWFAAHFHGQPAMRDTETFNHVRRAVDDLKQRLAGNDHGPSANGAEEEH